MKIKKNGKISKSSSSTMNDRVKTPRDESVKIQQESLSSNIAYNKCKLHVIFILKYLHPWIVLSKAMYKYVYVKF